MVPASQLPLRFNTSLPEVIGGLTRDGIGSGWGNPDSQRSPPCHPRGWRSGRALQDHGAETWSPLTAKDLLTDQIIGERRVLVVKALEQI